MQVEIIVGKEKKVEINVKDTINRSITEIVGKEPISVEVKNKDTFYEKIFYIGFFLLFLVFSVCIVFIRGQGMLNEFR